VLFVFVVLFHNRRRIVQVNVTVPNRPLYQAEPRPDIRQIRFAGSVHLVPHSRTNAQFAGLLEKSPTVARA
jgi:hypothetical protein